MRISPVNYVYTNNVNNINNKKNINKTIFYNNTNGQDSVSFNGNKQKALDLAKPFTMIGIILGLLAETEQMTFGNLAGIGFSFAGLGAVIGYNIDKIKHILLDVVNEIEEEEKEDLEKKQNKINKQ